MKPIMLSYQNLCTTLALSLLFVNSLVAQTGRDSAAVVQLHDQAYVLELNNPDSAIVLYDSAARLANAIRYKIGEGRSYNYKAIVKFEQGKYLEAKTSNLKAIPIFREIKYELGVAACLINLGNIELYLGNYDECMDYYIEGTGIYQSLNDSIRLMVTYNNMSSLFLHNQEAEKAVEYAEKARDISGNLKDSITLADSYINLANACMMKKDSALYQRHSMRAYQIAEKTRDLYNQLLSSNNLAYHYLQSRQFDSAQFFADKTIAFAEVYKNPYNISESKLTAGKLAFQQKDILKSRALLKEAQAIANEYNLGKLQLLIAYQQYLVENALNNYKLANSFLAEYSQLKDSVNRGETKKYIHLLEQKFENQKKEQTIASQSLEIENQEKILARNNLLFVAAGLIVVLLGMAIYFQKRSATQKGRAHAEQVKRLKAEKKNTAMRALVEGEEQERKRLSRELHDGVNGGLAAIKMMVSGKKKSNGSAEPLEEIESMLGELSEEVREMSHNLMPGTLAKGGLSETVTELVQRFNHSEKTEFDLQCFGEIDGLDENTKFYSYRIIQELLKNVIKHADASECLVQLVQRDSILHICVEDNGRGMNESTTTNGIGMNNIRSRLEFLNGEMDCDSSAGEGTSINIDIPIKS